MKNNLCILLVAWFFSIHSEENGVTDLAVNDTQSILLTNALEDMQVKELSPPISLKKNGLYFLLPSSFNHPFPKGVSFRHRFNTYSFLEISYLHNKLCDIIIYRTTGFFTRETIKTLGRIYNNSLNVCYALKWNTRFLDPYISFGTGLYLPYTNYPNISVDVIPSIGSTLGFECSYGFLDLSVNYLLFKWNKVIEMHDHEYQDYEYKVNKSYKHQMRAIAALRIGVGLPF